MSDVTPDQARDFYRAAARFYRIPSPIQYFLPYRMTAGARPDRSLMVSKLRQFMEAGRTVPMAFGSWPRLGGTRRLPAPRHGLLHLHDRKPLGHQRGQLVPVVAQAIQHARHRRLHLLERLEPA